METWFHQLEAPKWNVESKNEDIAAVKINCREVDFFFSAL